MKNNPKKKTPSLEEAVKKLEEAEEQVIKEAGFEPPEDSTNLPAAHTSPSRKEEDPHPENIVIERMRKDIEMPIEPGKFKTIEKQLQDRSEGIQDQKLKLEKLQIFLTEYQKKVEERQEKMAKLGENIEKLREYFKKLNEEAILAKEENEKFIQELENDFKNFNL